LNWSVRFRMMELGLCAGTVLEFHFHVALHDACQDR
jgi:hypothetical protein